MTSDNGPFLNVKIGDPNTTITGPHTYVITYTVTDGLRVITADDAADPAMPQTVSAGDVELFWDLIGTGWDVGISSAKATVTGPGDGTERGLLRRTRRQRHALPRRDRCSRSPSSGRRRWPPGRP